VLPPLLLVAVALSVQGQTIAAVRVTDAPRMDGRLTEAVWRSAPAITQLTQKEPNEGEPALENSEIRFAYDEDALYIGARMFSRDPRNIRAQVTRRDVEGISEYIAISLDTYLDRRTAVTFGVTPTGVRFDLYHSSDSDDGDSGFDPVWEAHARIDSLGWTAEMRMPFNQLRFSRSDIQEWGLNVIRVVPARNEESFWRLIRRQENGWASKMGTLTGLRGIRPSRRLEAMPYVAANSRLAHVTDPADPFQERTQSAMRVGGDLKMGLGPNLTLDVTLNPDFGQVEGDPAEVNLTAYETFFDERRPFFTEGASLLDRRGLFYSRRIGAPPPGGAGAEFAEDRSNSTILGAAKLTGRLPSKLSIAALAAVTDREVVRTFDSGSGQFGRAVVAPQTAYAAASAQQEFGEDGSTLGGMFTMVQRDVDRGTPLANLVARTAISGIAEGRWRWADGAYDVNLWTGYTHVRGDSTAILLQQVSSRRYWQRPDANHLDVDPSRRSISGANLGLGHSKMAGKHWLWDIDYLFETPGFEPNDIGAFGAVDNRSLSGNLRWRETQPSRLYRNYELGLNMENGWSYHWLRRNLGAGVSGEITLPNFWDVEAEYWRSWAAYSDRLTRGGPVMGTADAWGTSIELRNRDVARYGIGLELGMDRNSIGGWEHGVELDLSARPGDRWELSLNPGWSRERDTRQYLTTEPNGRPATFGSRYVFSAVDLSEISAQLRVNYTFTPNLTLESYAEPFAASGRFHSFGELLAPRSRDLLFYGTNGTSITRNADGSYTVDDGAASFDIDNEDFNERSFRSNVVLRWEYRPGSMLFLVWQQDRGADRPFATARPSDLFDALNTRGDSFFAVKLSYWIPLR
jgi:hypothetical protein